jgi:hypothetical protein
LLTSLDEANGALITRDEQLYDVVARSRPHKRHAAISPCPDARLLSVKKWRMLRAGRGWGAIECRAGLCSW